MRGVGKLGRQTPEGVLLGTLVASAAFVLLVNDLGDGRSTTGYVILSWLFLGASLAYWGYLYLNRPDRVDIWTVSLLCAALFFSVGGILGRDSVVASTARVGFSVQALLLLALGLIASRTAFRLVCPARGTGALKSNLCARVQATRLWVVLLTAAVIWGLRGYSASQGLVVTHVGDVMTEVGTGASIAIQLAQLGRPLNLFLGVVLLLDQRRLRRGVGLLLTAGEVLFAVLWTRRLLLEVIVALLVVGLWTGRRLRLRQLVIYTGLVAVTLVLVWPFMFHLRTVANTAGLHRAELATRTHTMMFQVIPEAVATFDLGASFEAGSQYLDNVRERAHILDLWLDIMAAHRDGAPFMGGRAFRAWLVSAIPRALWPDKERLMATETWQVEEAVQEHFGLPIVDMASTVPTHGYADGGLLGVLIYMALLGALLGLCERSAGSFRSALLGLYVYAMGMSLAIQVESTGHFVFARLLAVLLLIDWLAGPWIERWLTVPRRRARLGRPAWEV